MTPTDPRPTTAPVRSAAPDLARGAMLALIALANVGVYLHARDYGFRQQIIESTPADQIVRAATTLLIDGRAYPLFAALFGFGLMRIYRKERGRGRSDDAACTLLRRRCGWLAVIGLVHAALLFPGDILGTYALVGLLVIGLRRASDRALAWTAASLLVVTAAAAALIYAETSAHVERTYMWSFTMGDPLQAAGWRLVDWVLVPFGVPGVFTAAIVGMWIARHGLLTRPGDHLPLLRVAALVGLTVGLAGGLPAALVAGGVWAPTDGALVAALHAVSGVLGGIGLLAALTLLSLRRRFGILTAAVSACGRRSLTCYLAQSVVFVAVFIPYAGDLGATASSTQAAAIALATWSATVVAASMMARRGHDGPAENLMRRLTYGRTNRLPSENVGR